MSRPGSSTRLGSDDGGLVSEWMSLMLENEWVYHSGAIRHGIDDLCMTLAIVFIKRAGRRPGRFESLFEQFIFLIQSFRSPSEHDVSVFRYEVQLSLRLRALPTFVCSRAGSCRQLRRPNPAFGNENKAADDPWQRYTVT